MKLANNILPILFSGNEIFVTPETEDLLKNGLGSNHKGIIVLYRDEQQEELLEFLKKILQAAALDYEKDIWIKGITEQLPFSYLLSFGIPPLQLGLALPVQHFQPTEFSKVTFLFSPALSELENNKLAKSKLWAALQAIFLTKE